MSIKTASLVWFYMGEESYLTRLAQETVPVWRALEGYDHQVLLRFETDIGPFELSKAAERRADVLDIPTHENLVAQLNDLAARGYVTDLYIFSHGIADAFFASRGDYGDNVWLRQGYIESRVPNPLKLRMVWQCNCYGSTMNDLWRKLGARATAGSRFINFYPTRFKNFAKRWQRGETFGAALHRSDTKAIHTPVHAYIAADAMASRKKWGGCPFGRTVLGRHECAQRYFEDQWMNSGDWCPGQTGKQNMNYSSRMIVSGNRRVTRDLVW